MRSATGSPVLDDEPVWRPEELDAGEMCNSSSIIAWLIAGAGLATDAAPAGARARAGLGRRRTARQRAELRGPRGTIAAAAEAQRDVTPTPM